MKIIRITGLKNLPRKELLGAGPMGQAVGLGSGRADWETYTEIFYHYSQLAHQLTNLKKFKYMCKICHIYV
jgi:hypothetical protein